MRVKQFRLRKRKIQEFQVGTTLSVSRAPQKALVECSCDDSGIKAELYVMKVGCSCDESGTIVA